MQELPRTLKIVTVYGVIFVVLFLGMQWWQTEQRKAKVSVQGSSTQVSLPRDRSGHYFWQGRINGQEVEFLVDTGATTS
ncbi:MAG: TIGR02281 family clan AA aspartic protease, partial [Brachymonas sp.]|nr:TIGR02281 family clan AA aspartic protease [Brachymonas sp.]